MNKVILKETQDILTRIAQKSSSLNPKRTETALYKKMLRFIQVGAYYYAIYNTEVKKIEYISSGLRALLGYSKKEFTLDFLFQIIHPDDIIGFMNFHAIIAQFLNGLPPEKIIKYKANYDFRVKKKNGEYIPILQQMSIFQTDQTGCCLRAFVVHTDITLLNKKQDNTLSIIGLDGESSYFDLRPKMKIIPSQQIMNSKEKDVFYLLTHKKTEAEIAETLNISIQDVIKRRERIFHKTNTQNLLDFSKLALEKRWL